MKTIKEMGLPVLVVLVPFILAVADKNSDFGIMQWLLCLFWLLLIVGGAIWFPLIAAKESIWEKCLVFVGIECFLGCIISLFLQAFVWAFVSLWLGIAASTINGFFDLYRGRTRYKVMSFCWYSSLFCGLVSSALGILDVCEQLCQIAVIMQFVLFSSWIISVVYNGIELLIKRKVQKN